MVITKNYKKCYHVLVSLMLMLFTILMPTALIYKIEIGSLDFSVSYAALLLLMFFVGFDLLLNIKLLIKNKFVLLALIYVGSVVVSFAFTGFNFAYFFPIIIFLFFFAFGFLNYEYVLLGLR